MICKHILLITFLNKPEFFCTQLNGFKYCYLALIIQCNIYHLFGLYIDLRPGQAVKIGYAPM